MLIPMVNTMKKLATVLFFSLLCSTAQAQPLSLLFESQPNTRFNDSTLGVGFGLLDANGTHVGLRDANGDGMDDLIIRRNDNEGSLEDLLVLTIAEDRPQPLWQVENVPATLGLQSTDLAFFGFADTFGTGVRQAIFTNTQGVHLFDPNDNALAWSSGDFNGDGSVLVGATDVTGDGFADLLLYLPNTRQGQVWSIHE